MCQLASDRGIELSAKVWIDSSAALGVVGRKGNGKLRHVRVGMLWIQEKVEEGELEVRKVLGENNPADLMTKYLTRKVMDHHMGAINQEEADGRLKLSLKL